MGLSIRGRTDRDGDPKTDRTPVKHAKKNRDPPSNLGTGDIKFTWEGRESGIFMHLFENQFGDRECLITGISTTVQTIS